jgi:multidrug efflux system outer membrane protein
MRPTPAVASTCLPRACAPVSGGKSPGEYTRNGAVEEQLDLREERPFPEPLPDYLVGIDVSWEVDIWHRLRDAQKSAVLRYLASAEGRRFAQTHLVAEIASSYYELVALDRKEAIIRQMIDIQQSALRAVQMQKQAGEATELAVRRFEAELQKNRAELFQLHQDIRETENRINFLAGRFPDGGGTRRLHTVHRGAGADRQRHTRGPAGTAPGYPPCGTRPGGGAARRQRGPGALLSVAEPGCVAGLQLGGSRPAVRDAESLAYGIAADLFMPLLNRRGIRAAYNGASALQEQALPTTSRPC